MPIEAYAKGSDEQLSKHFQAKEFDCKCSRASCDYTLVDSVLLELLENLRDTIGHPIVIESAFRCKERQADLRSEGKYKTVKEGKTSTHEEGRAVDIRVRHFSGLELETLARDAGFRAVGVARNWIHVDTRTGKDRRWTY